MLTSCRLSFSLLFLARCHAVAALNCRENSLPTCRYIHRTYNSTCTVSCHRGKASQLGLQEPEVSDKRASPAHMELGELTRPWPYHTKL